MSKSRELETVKNCSSQLETALAGLDRGLVYFLSDEGFITQEVCDDVLHPRSMLTQAQKAHELVRGIRRKVELGSSSYHTLVDRLRQGGPHYSGIVRILDEEYYGTPQASLPQQAAHVPSQASVYHSSTASSPDPQGPTYEDYVACIPHSYRYKLQKEVDFERETDLHLGEIAHLMVNWRMFAPDLGLTEVDIHDVAANNPMDAELQRRAALQTWKGRLGFHATYEALLLIFVRRKAFKCAKKLVTLLGARDGPSPGQSAALPDQSSHAAMESGNQGERSPASGAATTSRETIRPQAPVVSRSSRNVASSQDIGGNSNTHESQDYSAVSDDRLRRRPVDLNRQDSGSRANLNTPSARVQVSSVTEKRLGYCIILLCLLAVGTVIGIVYFYRDGSLVSNGAPSRAPVSPSAAGEESNKPANVPESASGDQPVETPRKDPNTDVKCHQVNDVGEVFKYLKDIRDWEVLCSELGVQESTINELRRSPSNPLYGCLKAFVNLGPSHSCWEKVAAVVCGPLFHNGKVGSKIVRDKELVMPSECKHEYY